MEGLVTRGTQKFSRLTSRLPRGWNFQSRKTLRQIFLNFCHRCLETCPGDLFATRFNRENRVFLHNEGYFHFYLMLCSTLFCLRFEFHFLIHLAPFMHHYHCSYLHLLPSFLLDTFVVLIASCLYVGHAYILMLLCFIECMFG